MGIQSAWAALFIVYGLRQREGDRSRQTENVGMKLRLDQSECAVVYFPFTGA
jgi:hypothetical protein